MENINFLIVGEATTNTKETFKVNSLFTYPFGATIDKDVLNGITAELYVQAQEAVADRLDVTITRIVLLNLCPLGVVDESDAS